MSSTDRHVCEDSGRKADLRWICERFQQYFSAWSWRVVIDSDEENFPLSGAFVGGEPMWTSVNELIACERWAPKSLDVLDDQIVSGKMIDKWSLSMVVHAVGQVANECDVFTEFGGLADSEWSAKDAHVQVDTHDHDVVDVVLLEDIKEFLAMIGNEILLGDLQFVDLSSPCFPDFTFFVAVTAHIRVVNGQVGFSIWIGPAPAGAPTFGGGK